MDNHTFKKALYGTTIFALIMVSIAALSYAHTYSKSLSPENGWNTLSVSGEGKVTGIPDTAQVSFSVSTDGKDAASAQGDTIKKMDDITKYLLDQGIKKEDIQTTGYNVYPKQTYGCYGRVPCGMTTTGYTVSQEVTVKIHDTAKAGDILGTVVSKGATGVSGPIFVIADKSKYENEARAQAIEKAKAKAKAIADASGIRLGKLLSVTDDGMNTNGPMDYAVEKGGGMGMMAPQAMPTPNVQAGSQDIQMNVTLTYALR